MTQTDHIREYKMENSKKIFIVTEAILAVIVLLVSITMLREKSREKWDKVSVIIQDSDDNAWAAFKYGLRMAAQDWEIDMVVVGTGEKLSEEEEMKAIQNQIDLGADAVIVQPVPGDGMQSSLEKLQNRIPIMLVESSAAKRGIECNIPVVLPDNYAMGRALGEELQKDYNGNLKGKKLGIVSQYADSNAVTERREGLKSSLDQSEIEICWEVSDISADEKDTILESQAKADVIIALDDYSLTLVGKSVSANSLYGALVYGIGNSTEAVYYLDAGFVQCLVAPDEFNMGYKSLTEAAKRVKNMFREPQSRIVSFTVIRRDTLFSEENQKILFTMSQ